MPLAWVSCAGSRFLETNHEFVQSNECEAALRLRAMVAAGWRAGRLRVVPPIRPPSAKDHADAWSRASEGVTPTFVDLCEFNLANPTA